MSMQKISENELRMFWRCSLSAKRPTLPLTAVDIEEIREELEVLGDMTDWPRLREACRLASAALETPQTAKAAIS